MHGVSGSYRDLLVWQKTMDMAEAVYDLTCHFPEDEKFSLTSQIKRSSVSVSSNIAEGQGRGSNRDFQRCLWIANGSLKEMESQLIFAGRRAWITRDQAANAWDLAQESGKMLKGLIRSLD
ncbi:MAG: four helix bundle protein [Planctomycetes bacterium]|nr:four helix bundle protein [Planctomycetota bacterium]